VTNQERIKQLEKEIEHLKIEVELLKEIDSLKEIVATKPWPNRVKGLDIQTLGACSFS